MTNPTKSLWFWLLVILASFDLCGGCYVIYISILHQPLNGWIATQVAGRQTITLTAARTTQAEDPTIEPQTVTPPDVLAESPTHTAVSSLTPSAQPSPSPTAPRTPTVTMEPLSWEEMPVIPALSPAALKVYARGQALGRNPHAFSKVGDCESTPSWFLGDFDSAPTAFNLGQYVGLLETINYFSGSFGRESLAVRVGFNTASVISEFSADRSVCLDKETPLTCEYRMHRPSFAIIAVGSNEVFDRGPFESHLRRILKESIDRGVVPILTTKADNQEKDHTMNATIASLAREYDVPLWNFWRVIQPLPNNGLQKDNIHLTWGPNRFDDPLNMSKTAWPQRNLTALQVLEAMRLGVEK